MATSTSTRSSPAQGTREHSTRKPTKKSSFLSLKREKRSVDIVSSSASPDSPYGQRSRAGSSATSPSSFHVSDLDTPELPAISGPYKSRDYSLKYSNKSIGSSKEARSSSKGKGRQRHERSPVPEDQSYFLNDDQESIPWPSMDAEDFEVRSRTTSGPSLRSWDYHAPIPRPLKYPYRDSGSSTLSHFDPLPQTPVDDYSFRGRVFTTPDVVAAPVSGVETMDALVDGMNGSSDDDHYSPFTTLSNASRSKTKPTGHHPLYHPPLPTPPPGVKLGGAMPRKSRKQSGSDSEPERSYPSSPRRRREREQPPRPQPPRASSNTTVTRYPTFTMPKISMSSSAGSLSSKDDRSVYLGSSTEEICQVQPIETVPKTVAPSISEIIRSHAPAVQQVRSRPVTADSAALPQASGFMSGRRVSRTIETPGDDDDGDLVSRSSVDTIAEEVRRTIRIQTISPIRRSVVQATSPITSARPQSASTDYTQSPRSDARRDSTMFSDVSSHPLDLSNLTKAPTNSASQAIAQYLRSNRLTTVLRLIRGPHASREVPLNVSFSDLGSPSGSPLVVFLGLGCVRHIMGLYDEMAELLGLRLITIDRCVFCVYI